MPGSGIGNGIAYVREEGSMTEDNEARLKHLEDQIGALAGEVEEAKEILSSFLGDIGALQSELLNSRRFAAKVDVNLLTGQILSWMVRGVEDESTAAKVREFIVRTQSATVAHIESSLNPEANSDGFRQRLSTYFKGKPFSPFFEDA